MLLPLGPAAFYPDPACDHATWDAQLLSFNRVDAQGFRVDPASGRRLVDMPAVGAGPGASLLPSGVSNSNFAQTGSGGSNSITGIGSEGLRVQRRATGARGSKLHGRILESLGYKVVLLPYYEWMALPSLTDKMVYLRELGRAIAAAHT